MCSISDFSIILLRKLDGITYLMLIGLVLFIKGFATVLVFVVCLLEVKRTQLCLVVALLVCTLVMIVTLETLPRLIVLRIPKVDAELFGHELAKVQIKVLGIAERLLRRRLVVHIQGVILFAFQDIPEFKVWLTLDL